MQLDELVNSLKHGVSLLELNRDTITPEVLANLEQLVVQLQNPLIGSLLGPDIVKTIEAIQKLFQIEKDVLTIKPGKRLTTNDSLINALNNLQHRPIILRMIAGAI